MVHEVFPDVFGERTVYPLDKEVIQIEHLLPRQKVRGQLTNLLIIKVADDGHDLKRSLDDQSILN